MGLRCEPSSQLGSRTDDVVVPPFPFGADVFNHILKKQNECGLVSVRV